MLGVLACLVLAQTPDRLTNAQVLARIRPIPVFLAVGPDGKPSLEGAGVSAKVPIFFSSLEATARAKSQGSQFKVVPVSLAEALSLASLGKLDFIPSGVEQDRALALAKASNPEVKEFPGVPLFAVANGSGYVAIEQASRPSVPLFFSFDEAEEFRKKSAPADGKIVPTNLDQVMTVLRTAPASQAAGIVLIPHRKALEEAKALSKSD
jgi:hypothetical protein